MHKFANNKGFHRNILQLFQSIPIAKRLQGNFQYKYIFQLSTASKTIIVFIHEHVLLQPAGLGRRSSGKEGIG
jgi:hypothetical protein